MIRNLSRGFSMKSFDNEETTTYQKNYPKNLPNFFISANQTKDHYTEKSFHFFNPVNGDKTRDRVKSLRRTNSTNTCWLNKSQARKPLDEILRSNKESLLFGLKKPSREKILYQTIKSEAKEAQKSNLKQTSYLSNQKPNFEQINVRIKTDFNEYKEAVDKNFTLIKLRQNVKHVKTLQSQARHSRSRSCSNRRKGLECTLYQRSLQKKINQSVIKSNKKLLTVKKKFEKTQHQWGFDSQTPQKDIKKILLKRKVKESENLNQTSSFISIVLEKSKQKDINHKFVNQKGKSRQKAIEKSCESKMRRILSKSKNESINQSLKSKKLVMNDRIQQNFIEIHQKYKFILNYLSDIDIIGKLNGYQIAGKEQCKWILLMIDEVYDMIKHSDETKLKGIDYTRDYQFTSLKKEENFS